MWWLIFVKSSVGCWNEYLMGGSLTTVLCCHMWCKVFRMSSCHHISGALCSCTTWHFRVWLGQREACVQTLQLKQIASQQNMVCGAVRWWNPHCPSREHFFFLCNDCMLIILFSVLELFFTVINKVMPVISSPCSLRPILCFNDYFFKGILATHYI